MKSLRLAAFALGAIAAVAASGCRTAGLRDLARPGPSPAPRVGQSAVALLADHNRNARQVVSLEASPSITVNHRALTGGLSGKLAFDRQKDFSRKNFKLVLKGPMMNDVADIGSNDEEFWFWIKDNKDPGVYYCRYDADGTSPLTSGMQPDWVIEALGLRVVPREEAEQTRVVPGKETGTLVLTHTARAPRGQSFVRETVLTESTGRVKEHRVLSADRKTLLARATIYSYQSKALPAPEGETAETVDLPEKLRLEWLQEKLVLDLTVRELKVNPTFSDERRQAIFVEPEIPGVARRDLAEMAGLAAETPRPEPADERRASVRQSLPAPPPRVRLDGPAPLGRRDAATPRAAATAAPGVAMNLGNTYTRGVEEVVGPPLPRVSEPARAYIQSNTGWRSVGAPTAER